jgi:DNA-binding NarL/FixJ family response regulator
VLAEMATGANNTTIAERLHVTVRAVERHINSIFAKLGLTEEGEVHRRVRAVLLYLAG